MKKLEKKIRVLKDLELKTPFETHFLSEGEVKTIRFKNLQSFKTHVELGDIEEAREDEQEVKQISVIYPDEEG